VHPFKHFTHTHFTISVGPDRSKDNPRRSHFCAGRLLVLLALMLCAHAAAEGQTSWYTDSGLLGRPTLVNLDRSCGHSGEPCMQFSVRNSLGNWDTQVFFDRDLTDEVNSEEEFDVIVDGATLLQRCKVSDASGVMDCRVLGDGQYSLYRLSPRW
jgi:hypothetical protein